MKSMQPGLQPLTRSSIAGAWSRLLTRRELAERGPLPSVGSFSTKQLWTELAKLSRWQSRFQGAHTRIPEAQGIRVCAPPGFIFLIQPHQLGGIVMQHHFDLVFLDSEGEQGADEDSHSIDTVHVQDLAEIASNDASLGADFPDRLNRFHRIGYGPIQARNHWPANSPHVRAGFG